MNDFDNFLNFIKEISGIDLTSKKEINYQKLNKFAKINNISNFKDMEIAIRTNQKIKQEVLNLITINETYFYRELSQLKAIINFAKDISGCRILCAPCSSGDEVYSIAMLSVEHNAKIQEIKGIDINSDIINMCQEGIYKSRNLHRLNAWQKQRFFIQEEDNYKIKKEILPNCSFKIANVFSDEILNLGKFDVILSRNMMIYFNDEFRLKCIENLGKLLKFKGRIYVGHADLVPYNPYFIKKFENGTSFYEKIE